MKKRRFAIVFLMMLLLLPALNVKAATSEDYFPLNLNNEWTYQQTGPTVNRTVVVNIDEMRQSSSARTRFFKLNDYNGSYHWVRRSSNGMVIEANRNIWYLFDRRVGQSWTMNMNDEISGVCPGTNGAVLTVVSRNELVKVPAGNFNTIHIRYRTGVMDAGITDEWFAPGVGLIKRAESSFAGGVSMELVRAVVAGRIIM